MDPTNPRILYASTWNVRRTPFSLSSGGEGSALYKSKDGRMIECSGKGMLYYADTPMEWLDEKKALLLWEWIHENREKLICFRPDKCLLNGC